MLKLWSFIQSDTDEIRKRLDEEEKQQEDNPQERKAQEAEPKESGQQESGNESRSGMNDGADKPAAGGEKEDGGNHPVPFGQAGLSEIDNAAGKDAENEKEASGGQDGNQDGINDSQNGNLQGNAEPQTKISPGNTGTEPVEVSGAGAGYREKAEQAAKELGKCLPAYSQEPGEPSDGVHPNVSNPDVKAGDMDWNGSWADEDKAEEGKAHPMRGEAAEDSNAAADSYAVEEKETQSPDSNVETTKKPEPLKSELPDVDAADIMDGLPSEDDAAIPQSDAELISDNSAYFRTNFVA